jgi:hypothetical protein
VAIVHQIVKICTTFRLTDSAGNLRWVFYARKIYKINIVRVLIGLIRLMIGCLLAW